jgi:hypothetical protein
VFTDIPAQCCPDDSYDRWVLIYDLRKRLDFSYRCGMFTIASALADQILNILEAPHVGSRYTTSTINTAK